MLHFGTEQAELTRDFTEATEAITACQAQVAKREQEKARAEVSLRTFPSA